MRDDSTGEDDAGRALLEMASAAIATASRTCDERDAAIAALLEAAWLAYRRREGDDPALRPLRAAADAYRAARAPDEYQGELPPMRGRDAPRGAREAAVKRLAAYAQEALDVLASAPARSRNDRAGIAADALATKAQELGLHGVTRYDGEQAARLADLLLEARPQLHVIVAASMRAAGAPKSRAHNDARHAV